MRLQFEFENLNVFPFLKVIQIYWSVVLTGLVNIIRSPDLFKPRTELPVILTATNELETCFRLSNEKK